MKCISTFRELLWMALALVAALFPGCSGEKTDQVHIIYSGHLEGYLEPCPCPEGRVGGLSRLATVSRDSLARWGGQALLLDAGVFAEAYGDGYRLKNKAILKAFALMRYDAVNVTASDLISGFENLHWASDTLGLPLISANLVYEETGARVFPGYVVRKVGEKTIGVIGLGDIRPFDIARVGVTGLKYVDPDSALRWALGEVGSECDWVVLLCDLTARAGRSLGVNFPNIDVIISSRDLMPRGEVNRFGASYVVGCSRKGARMTILTLDASSDDSLACRFSSLLLDSGVKGNGGIEELVKSYRRSKTRTSN